MLLNRAKALNGSMHLPVTLPEQGLPRIPSRGAPPCAPTGNPFILTFVLRGVLSLTG